VSIITPDKLKQLKLSYPPGTRVKLIQMNDPYTKLRPGEIGTVTEVDDIGTIHVSWECGSSLGIAFGEDLCEIITNVPNEGGEIAKAHFIRKACTIKDLKGCGNERGSQFVIEEVVELEPGEFEAFADNLLEDYGFIAQRIDKMYTDVDKIWHCILAKVKGAKYGILVESEGYDYARYAAYYSGEDTVNDTIKNQIIAIRDTGETNMFDIVMVQRMAYEREYFELVAFIEDHKTDYYHFIITGEI
jgi:hypothetical protein